MDILQFAAYLSDVLTFLLLAGFCIAAGRRNPAVTATIVYDLREPEQPRDERTVEEALADMVKERKAQQPSPGEKLRNWMDVLSERNWLEGHPLKLDWHRWEEMKGTPPLEWIPPREALIHVWTPWKVFMPGDLVQFRGRYYRRIPYRGGRRIL